MALLNDAEWVKWSDREISRRFSVSDRFVNGLRGALTANIRSDNFFISTPTPTERTYTDKHGNESVMDTTGIGQRSRLNSNYQDCD
jgi:hypothetical protein